MDILSKPEEQSVDSDFRPIRSGYSACRGSYISGVWEIPKDNTAICGIGQPIHTICGLLGERLLQQGQTTSGIDGKRSAVFNENWRVKFLEGLRRELRTAGIRRVPPNAG